jgi:hypothetical protein
LTCTRQPSTVSVILSKSSDHRRWPQLTILPVQSGHQIDATQHPRQMEWMYTEVEPPSIESFAAVRSPKSVEPGVGSPLRVRVRPLVPGREVIRCVLRCPAPRTTIGERRPWGRTSRWARRGPCRAPRSTRVCGRRPGRGRDPGGTGTAAGAAGVPGGMPDRGHRPASLTCWQRPQWRAWGTISRRWRSTGRRHRWQVP